MRRQLPPPSSWQEFEDMCLSAFRELWKDPDTTKHGRPGQSQNGVDIYGRPGQGKTWAGVQCKLQTLLTGGRLTVDDMKAEVENALSFRPKLTQYIIATTSPQDAALQKAAREITEDHLQKGLFSVAVYGWEDILDLLYRTGAVSRFYSEIDLAPIGNELRDIKGLLEDHLQNTQLASQPAIHVSEAAALILTPEHSGEIDYSKRLLEESKPTEALRYLQATKERIWPQASPVAKYRLLTNIGAANLALGNEREASTFFLEALQFNPDEEKALCNAALGYLIIGQHDESRRLVDNVLARNPANTGAYSLLVHLATDTKIDGIITSIPSGLLDSCEIAYALGHAYMKRGIPAEARQWFERALKTSTPSNAAQVQSYLGASIIEAERSNHEGCFAHANRKTREEVYKGVALLTEALNQVKGLEVTPDIANWLHNRAVGKRVLGDLRGGLHDLQEALRFDPKNVGLVKGAAILCIADDRYQEAIPLLESIKDDPSVPEAWLLLAQSYRVQKDYDRASRTLDALFRNCHNDEVLQEAKRVQVRVLASQGKGPEAVQFAEDLAHNSESVPNLIEAAYANRNIDRLERSMEYATKAKDLLNQDSSFWDILSVADELYVLQETDLAIPLYESIIEPTSDSPFTRRLVSALIKSGFLGKALDIARGIRESAGLIAFYSQVEAGILEEIDDLPNARAVCEQYLAANPDDPSMLVRLAVIEYRAANSQAVDRLLDRQIDCSNLSLHENAQLARLLAARARWREALDVMYEARRRFFDVGEAHGAYITLFLTIDKNECPWLSPTSVEVGSAVCVQDVADARSWWLIEDRANPSGQLGEIPPTHPLATRLLGKALGDQVPYKESSPKPEILRIVELMSKYVHAFRESGAKLETLFPGTTGFTSIHVGEPNPDNTPTEGMAKVLEMIMVDGERAKELVDLYRRGILTINQLATLLGRDVVDAIRALTSSPDVGISCTSGDLQSIRPAISAIVSPKRLMADVTAILTMHWLGVRKEVTDAFGNIAVAQSTVDLLHENIERYRLARGGYGVMGMTDGRFTLGQVSADEVTRMSEEVNTIIEWLRESAEVLPCNPGLGIRRSQRDELGRALGRSFADTALIAVERKYTLFSDDSRFRRYVNDTFQVPGVWTQVVLQGCAHRRSLSHQDYDRAVVRLVQLNYQHTLISSSVLMESAREANWGISEPFRSVLKVLEDGRIVNATKVAARFLRLLYADPVPAIRPFVVQAVLDSLTRNHESDLVLKALAGAVREQLVLMPNAMREVMGTIQDWPTIRNSSTKS